MKVSIDVVPSPFLTLTDLDSEFATLENELLDVLVTLPTKTYQKIIDGKALSSKELEAAIFDGLLLSPSTAGFWHNITLLEIETITVCNLRCTFCPNAVEAKGRRVMAESVWRTILDRAAAYGVEAVALHHNSEPLLDPSLESRLEDVKQHNMQVALASNGVLLDGSKVSMLSSSDVVRSLTINLPTADGSRYRTVTGTKIDVEKVLLNIKAAHSRGLPIEIAVNGSNRKEEATEIRRLLPGIEVVVWNTTSRAASVKHWQAPRHKGYLNGCCVIAGALSVGVEGNAFLCCQDSKQAYGIGNVLTSAIEDICGGPIMTRYRKWVCGLSKPPADFICRRCEWTCPKTRHLYCGNPSMLWSAHVTDA